MASSILAKAYRSIILLMGEKTTWQHFRPSLFAPEPPRPAADVNADGKPQPAPTERSLPELIKELIALMIEQRNQR